MDGSVRILIGGRSFALPPDVTISRFQDKIIATDGNGNSTTLCRAPDNTVSRNAHARIWLNHGKLLVADLGSTNGTEVNGKMLPGKLQDGSLHPVPVASGSEVVCGTIVLTVFVGEGPASIDEDSGSQDRGLMRKMAQNYEKEHEWHDALVIYRALGDHEDAGRMNELIKKEEQSRPAQTVIHQTFDNRGAALYKPQLGGKEPTVELPEGVMETAPKGPPQCAQCGEVLPGPGARFCPSCSAPVGQPKRAEAR